MKIKIEFAADNAAFEDMDSEVARILRALADRVGRASVYVMDGDPVIDANGNTVGRFRLSNPAA